MTTFLIIMIVPGLVCAYFMILRPILTGLPALKNFYTQADGFWAKVSAIGGHSATIAWGYFLGTVGLLMQFLEPLAAAVGDPDIKQQVTDALQANPKILGYFAMAVSVITIAARLRSIAKSA